MIFFSAMVSLLYYVGLMQKVIKAIAVVLQFALRTTPIESFATAAHIFVGQVSYHDILYEPRHEKTNTLVSDLVRHKPGCTATEDG